MNKITFSQLIIAASIILYAAPTLTMEKKLSKTELKLLEIQEIDNQIIDVKNKIYDIDKQFWNREWNGDFEEEKKVFSAEGLELLNQIQALESSKQQLIQGKKITKISK